MANAARREGQRVGTVGHPVYSALFPVPVVCFLGTLLTDFAYAKSGGNLLWLAFSSWLLLAGLLVGVTAALVLLGTWFAMHRCECHSAGLISCSSMPR